jgi:hypothetical protein
LGPMDISPINMASTGSSRERRSRRLEDSTATASFRSARAYPPCSHHASWTHCPPPLWGYLIWVMRPWVNRFRGGPNRQKCASRERQRGHRSVRWLPRSLNGAISSCCFVQSGQRRLPGGILPGLMPTMRELSRSYIDLRVYTAQWGTCLLHLSLSSTVPPPGSGGTGWGRRTAPHGLWAGTKGGAFRASRQCGTVPRRLVRSRA